jgi:ADP-ribose pyrophosphatase YjhB (NUDIX family)
LGRVDYYRDPSPPAANSLVPGASAIVVDDSGRVLLQKRKDNALWALPGGVMEIGENIAQALTREVEEETGLIVERDYIVGVYTDPAHVFAYDDGEVRQEFSICFACRVVGGSLRAGDEASEVRFFDPNDVPALAMHPSIRRRLDDFQRDGREAVIA